MDLWRGSSILSRIMQEQACDAKNSSQGPATEEGRCELPITSAERKISLGGVTKEALNLCRKRGIAIRASLRFGEFRERQTYLDIQSH